MKSTFNIGEISELLNIPKSTLRYWESKGLLRMPRGTESNYREYNHGSIYTISDLAHFRCLGMPLQEMKRLPHLSPKDLASSLIELEKDLDRRLQELYTSKEYINKKLSCIEEYNILLEHQYQEEVPDYNCIYQFSIDDANAWSIYIKDQYQSILLYDPNKSEIETGLVIPTSPEQSKIWSKNNQTVYLSFVLKVDYSAPSIEAFRPHTEYITDLGYEVTNIVARYLFSAWDDKYLDYYKAFAEVKRK
ncbi:MAG: putative transcriptional regulator [Firmicutes bacterium]|nr:putative transcriptional regulator [Bacillota bacterium]